jgi:hypothetical protein
MLGSHLLKQLEMGTALYEQVPDLAYGFTCLRQSESLMAIEVDRHIDTIGLLSSAHTDPLAADIFAWNALPLPGQGSKEQALPLEAHWMGLIERHPQWIKERPLPENLVQRYITRSAKLHALWRQAKDQQVEFPEEVPRRRVRP